MGHRSTPLVALRFLPVTGMHAGGGNDGAGAAGRLGRSPGSLFSAAGRSPPPRFPLSP